MSKNLRFTLLGLFAMLLTFGFTVKTQAQVEDCNPQLLTYSVTLEGIVYTADVDEDAKTLDFTVPFGTADYLDMGGALILKGEFTLSEGSWMTHSEDPVEHQESGVSENDFSDPVAFTVHQESEGSCTVEYFVTITEAENGCNNIGSIELESSFWGCYEDEHDVDLMFVEGEGDAWTVEVPFGTDLSDVELTFTDADDCPGVWTISPDVFTFEVDTPLVVTVTAPNMISQKMYTLEVTMADASDAHLLLTFGFEVDEVEYWGTVTEGTHRVDVELPYGTDVTALAACWTVSDYACFFKNGPELTDKTLQVNCETTNDFTDPTHFTVVAQDGVSEDTYNVVVTFVDPDTDNSMTDLMIDGLVDCNGYSIDLVISDPVENVYTVRLREDMDEETSFTITYETPGFEATSLPASGFSTTFVDGVGVDIVVTAQDGTPATYTIMPEYVTASSNKMITEFGFGAEGNPFNQMYLGTIDQTAKTITVHVPFGTETDALIASFELDDEFASMTHSEENGDEQIPQVSGESVIDYSTPAAFTVFAEDCSTVEYFVTVVINENGGNDIEALTAEGMQYSACECEEGVEIEGEVSMEDTDIVVTVPFGTDLTTLVLDVELTEDATSDPEFPVTGYTVPFDVVVTAEDGLATKTYTVTVEVGEASDENMILTFGFDEEFNEGLENSPVVGVIDEVKNRIDVQVAYGTPVATLIASFTKSDFACVYLNGEQWTAADEQCSDESVVDFSTYQTYTVVAQNGDEAYYNVYVEVLPADTQNALTNFMVHDLPECFGDFTYDVAGTMSGMNINVSVKNGADVSAVEVTFDIPAKATVSPEPGVWDLSAPVVVTVTAQSGAEAVYTVTAVERAQNSEKKILTYSIGSSMGTINQTTKVIEVWVPWLTDVSSLKASFTLSTGAKMTHSEDSWVLQTSGVTANDFTTPVAYTVWAEDCTTLEYFVIVRITPNTNTSISQFTIDYTGCFCDAGVNMRTDDYARRIYVRIPYADANGNPISLKSLNVTNIGIAAGASVSPAKGVTDFSKGPVTYTVTAPDGVTKVAWQVFVENPPCDKTDILDWTFVGDVQVGDPVIDATNHTVTVTLVPGTDLTSMLANSELNCGATICCAAGNCAGSTIDFSGEGNCHTCVVTAQDKSITQDWTICVKMADVTKPVAYTTSVLAENCSDSVMVWGDKKGGNVYLVNEATANSINALVNAWTSSITTLAKMDEWLAMNKAARKLITDAVTAHTAAAAGYPYADSTVAISTTGLYSGLYFAFLVDAAGNVSCASEEAVFVDQCVVTVANLCDLRAGSDAYMYIVSGEVLVSYEEGSMKFVQDASCGIKVMDNLDAWPATYGVGQGLTNIKGTIDKTGNEFKFIPVCCYLPTKTTSGNTIVPVMLTWDEFVASCYDHERGYESMLVKITDPMIAFDDYSSANPLWVLDQLDLATVNAKGDYEWFIQKVFNANYIGTAIPTDPTIYQGIRTNVKWGTNLYGLITPRSKTDIIKVTGGILIADPNPANVDGVVPGNCGPLTVTIINQGIGNLTISALYLDDAAATDEFELIDPAQVPFTLGTWESMDVLVHFCPKNAGAESTTLLVEYGDGMVMEVPINGTTVSIFDAPYYTNFNSDTPGSVTGWTYNPNQYNYGRFGNNIEFGPGQSFWFGWAYAVPRTGTQHVYLTSPGIDLGSVEAPTLTFWLGTYFTSNFDVQVSTDMQQTWTVVKNFGTVGVSSGPAGSMREVDLSAYEGETIFIRFHSSQANYYVVDEVKVAGKVTQPIISTSPNPGDFGGVQVGETGSLTFSVTNLGVSILNVKKVEMMAGSIFELTDNNTYPSEVINKEYAFANNETTSLNVDVTFSPTDIGVYTGKLLVTYGLYSDMVVEIPFSGEGLSCYTAAEAFVGENWAAAQNSWFTYTAEKFQIVNINSCHPNNTTDPYVYSYDTWLDVYDDCDGTIIATNDDLEWDICPYNRASSGVTIAMNEGETVKIFWPWAFESEGDDQGFYFNIVPSYPIDGDVCETAIPLTLPVVNHFGSTTTFNDDYDMSPCSPFSNYMDGNDKVYSIDLPVEGYLTVNILGAYGSVHVLDKCPVEELEKRNCLAFASGPNGGEVTKRIQPGFYYVIVSTWAPPQTVDYLLNMSFEELSTGVDDNGLKNSMVVYPNPTQGLFTVSISNAEASDLTLELVNISGQVVYRNSVKSVYSYNEEIDASAFAKGVYYLKVNTGEEVKIEKVVIQ